MQSVLSRGIDGQLAAYLNHPSLSLSFSPSHTAHMLYISTFAIILFPLFLSGSLFEGLPAALEGLMFQSLNRCSWTHMTAQSTENQLYRRETESLSSAKSPLHNGYACLDFMDCMDFRVYCSRIIS